MRTKIHQLIQANLKTAGKGFRAEVRGDVAELYLYDVIDSVFGISAEAFIKELKSLKAKTVNLRINSPGGDVFEARAMATAIKSYPGIVNSFIDGLAASAATYVALSASSVEMATGSFLMIHKAWTFAIGNANDLMETAALLEKVDGSIVADYQAKTGKSAEELNALMDAETWFTAEEAQAAGFADTVAGAAVSDVAEWDLSAYEKAPARDVSEKARWIAAEKLRASEDEANADRHRIAMQRLRLYTNLA